MPGVMIQGTGSNVGKSMLVAGLCRAAKRRGLNVRPFKPQNMSNNAAVTADGGEIGRAQSLQARACGVQAHTDMNPVLLKPESDRGSAVIVNGKHLQTVKAREYKKLKPKLLEAVMQSYERLSSECDLVIIEGAGSPAEINLREGDIANMGFAHACNIPVILVGDIDRGGVIAQIIGTKTVLEKSDVDLISGFIINKFRGDPTLFDDGYEFIKKQVDWSGMGILPYFEDAFKLPAEDTLDIDYSHSDGKINIACLRLSKIANFDDLDPLALEPDVNLRMIEPGQVIPADIDLIIIPGTKSTMADLVKLRVNGWDIDIQAHVRRGGRVLGICGGYQILGSKIYDPDGIEGNIADINGLGLLNVDTTMKSGKSLKLSNAVHAETGTPISGYEIHIGQSNGPDCERPFALINGTGEGAVSIDGLVSGTYLHGIFASDEFRNKFLKELGGKSEVTNYDDVIEQVLDRLAEHIEAHLDVDTILGLAR